MSSKYHPRNNQQRESQRQFIFRPLSVQKRRVVQLAIILRSHGYLHPVSWLCHSIVMEDNHHGINKGIPLFTPRVRTLLWMPSTRLVSRNQNTVLLRAAIHTVVGSFYIPIGDITRTASGRRSLSACPWFVNKYFRLLIITGLFLDIFTSCFVQHPGFAARPQLFSLPGAWASPAPQGIRQKTTSIEESLSHLTWQSLLFIFLFCFQHIKSSFF